MLNNSGSTSASTALAPTNTSSQLLEVKSDSHLLTQPRPEYFEIIDLTDSANYLEIRRELFSSYQNNPHLLYLEVEKIIANKTLTLKERLRLLATSSQATSDYSVLLKLVLINALNNNGNIYIKTITNCLVFLATCADQDSNLTQDIYYLLLARVIYPKHFNTLSFELFTKAIFLPYFLKLLNNLKLTKQQYLTLLGPEVSGHNSAHMTAWLDTTKYGDFSHQRYLYFLNGLTNTQTKSQVFFAEEILELLSYVNQLQVNPYIYLAVHDPNSLSLARFTDNLLQLISNLPSNTPTELIRLYFNNCLLFTYSSGLYNQIITSKILPPSLKNTLLTNNALLASAASPIASRKEIILGKMQLQHKSSRANNPLLDNELTEMLRLMQKVQKQVAPNNTDYQLLRQNSYEQLAGMIVTEQLLLNKTNKTIPLMMKLLTTMCLGMQPATSSSYLMQLFSLATSDHSVTVFLQLCLPNDALSKQHDYLIPEYEQQLMAELSELVNLKLLSVYHLFQLFSNSLVLPGSEVLKVNFFSYTTTAAAQKLLDKIFVALINKGFSANYILRIYQNYNIYNQNCLRVRIEQCRLVHKLLAAKSLQQTSITSAADASLFAQSSSSSISTTTRNDNSLRFSPISVAMLNFWLKLGVSPTTIFALLTQEQETEGSNKEDLPRAAIRTQSGSNFRKISVSHALVTNDSDFTVLINSFRLLIRHGLPAELVINHFLKQCPGTTSSDYNLLDMIVWSFRNHLVQNNATGISANSLMLLFEFLAEIKPNSLRASLITSTQYSIFYNLDDALEKHLDIDSKLFRTLIGTIIWYACSYNFTVIGTNFKHVFLEYICDKFRDSRETFINILISCLNRNTSLGTYFGDNNSIAEEIIDFLITYTGTTQHYRSNPKPLTLEIGVQLADKWQTSESESRVAFLVNLLQSRKVPAEFILRVINQNVHCATPTLRHFDPKKIVNFSSWTLASESSTTLDLSSSAVTFQPLEATATTMASTSSASSATATEAKIPASLATTSSLSSPSLSYYFDHHIYPYYLVAGDAIFMRVLSEAKRQLTRICSATYAKKEGENSGMAAAEQFFKQLKNDGFFKIIFVNFYLHKLSPEAMESFFNFLATMEQHLLSKGYCPDAALEDFLNPYLQEDTADQLEATGFLLWLKAKYNLRTAPKEGIYSKVLLLLFICNNFRDVKTQAKLLLHCLDFNSSLGKILRFPRHYILAKVPLIGRACLTSIEDGSTLIAFNRLQYLLYLLRYNIQRASVYSPNPKAHALIPTTTLYFSNQTNIKNLTSITYATPQPFNPILDAETLATVMRDALKFDLVPPEQRLSILANSNSNLPIEAKLITEEEIAEIKKAESIAEQKRAKVLVTNQAAPNSDVAWWNFPPSTECFPEELGSNPSPACNNTVSLASSASALSFFATQAQHEAKTTPRTNTTITELITSTVTAIASNTDKVPAVTSTTEPSTNPQSSQSSMTGSLPVNSMFASGSMFATGSLSLLSTVTSVTAATNVASVINIGNSDSTVVPIIIPEAITRI